MEGLGTVIAWMVVIWIAIKLLPPLLDGLNKWLGQWQTRELMKQHPERSVEIRKAVQIQQAAWEPPAAAKKGGVMGKVVVMALCVIYILSPIDFIPDVIPVLGWGDDVVAGIIGLRALLK